VGGDGAGRVEVSRVVRITATAALLLVVPAGVAVAHLRAEGPKTASGPMKTHRSSRVTQRTSPTRHATVHSPLRPPGPAVRALDGAIAHTLSVTDYDLSFTLSETSEPPFPPGTSVPVAQGYGVADLAPQALSVSTTPGCVDAVSVRVDGDDVWDVYELSDPYGPASEISNWSQSTLLGFQGSVDICLGRQLGALATIGMCSPAGQLAVSAAAIASAKPLRTVTVNGESAEEYEVDIDPAGFLQQPNSTAAENAAIEAALEEIGSNPMTATVDVDEAGYIVEMDLSVAYADGVTATHSIVLSNFDKAGTISLPPLEALPPDLAPAVSTAVSTAVSRGARNNSVGQAS